MRPSKLFLRSLLLLVVVGWIALSWVFMLPPICREHCRAWNPCPWNLRQIDSAKAQWAAASGKQPGDAPIIVEANEYIKGNKTPACPRGGTYVYNPVGEPASCSLGKPELRRVRLSLREWEWQECHVTSNGEVIAEHHN